MYPREAGVNHFIMFQAYGGNNWPVRLYRGFFETRTTLINMWRGNPVLTALVFGLPLGFLSLICYSVCCADILDAEEEEAVGKSCAFHHRTHLSCRFLSNHKCHSLFL